MCQKTHWTDLLVYDTNNNYIGTLGEVIDAGELTYDIIVGKDGDLEAWSGFFIAAEEESPAWYTPDAPVDWAGFVEAFEGKGKSND